MVSAIVCQRRQKVNNTKRLEAFEHWIYRRILKVSWTAKKTNDQFLRKIRRERELLNTLKSRKTAYLGHVIRIEIFDLLQLLIEGKIERGREIGRNWTGIRTTGTNSHQQRHG